MPVDIAMCSASDRTVQAPFAPQFFIAGVHPSGARVQQVVFHRFGVLQRQRLQVRRTVGAISQLNPFRAEFVFAGRNGAKEKSAIAAGGGLEQERVTVSCDQCGADL